MRKIIIITIAAIIGMLVSCAQPRMCPTYLKNTNNVEQIHKI